MSAVGPAHQSRERRRAALRSSLRVLALTVVLVALYAIVPVPGGSGTRTIVGLCLGLVVLVVVVGWQIHTIVRSPHPVLRAVEVIGSAVPLLITVFAFAYLSLSRTDVTTFSEPLDRVGALYFTVATLTTVGFGDVTAQTDGARLVVTCQMLLDLALVAGLVRLVILATRVGLDRQSGTSRSVD